MKLLVGLGNPDKEYFNTFHNLGFMCVDKAAEIFGAKFSGVKCHAQVAELKVNGEKVIIAKPLTYMNLSGESVRELVNYFKIDLKDVFIAFDDFDLEKGFLRIREEGSGGTHNGMRNIVKELGTEKIARIRVGFNPAVKTNIPLIDLVLSPISKEDAPIFAKAVERAAYAMVDFASGESIQDVMQKYNGKAY